MLRAHSAPRLSATIRNIVLIETTHPLEVKEKSVSDFVECYFNYVCIFSLMVSLHFFLLV